MNSEFNLSTYLSNGIENIIKGAVKASLKNPRESVFLAKFALESKKSAALRSKSEEHGTHIPPFLIASITNSCNLHCAGCYARANNSCNGCHSEKLLTVNEWNRIFGEAAEIGISFILLAGGEPLIRKDVIQTAAQYKSVIFPVFTNGTMLNDEYIKLFDKSRNLIPVISIEGNRDLTDSRRGEGVFDRLISGMDLLKKSGIMFGASVTVTKENLMNVTSDSFISGLYEKGCKLVFYVEYVPVTSETKELAPDDAERALLDDRLEKLRAEYNDMIFLSFPGDEKASGGCLAAGRGFFHINSHGGAEPCPFSPYSDTDLKNITLLEALNSPLFRKLQSGEVLTGEHKGGCVLFEQEEKVKELLK